jgi:hypothetical protein
MYMHGCSGLQCDKGLDFVLIVLDMLPVSSSGEYARSDLSSSSFPFDRCHHRLKIR